MIMRCNSIVGHYLIGRFKFLKLPKGRKSRESDAGWRSSSLVEWDFTEDMIIANVARGFSIGFGLGNEINFWAGVRLNFNGL